MDYTRSDAFLTHVGTGNRMHQDSAPVTTEVTPEDLNMVIWSLMEVLKAAGITGAAFDKDTPATYTKLLTAFNNLFASTAINPQVDYLMRLKLRNHVAGLSHVASSVFILGDSIWGSGVGATSEKLGLPYMVCRSLLNAQSGNGPAGGHKYVTKLNAAAGGGAWTEQGVSVSGGVTYIANGLTNYCLSIAAGEWIQLTDRAIASIDVFYDSAASTTGVMSVTRNGVAVTTRPITAGTGIKNTYTEGGGPTYIRPSEGKLATNYIDTVRITFSAACVVKGILTPAPTTDVSPFVFLAGREGGSLNMYQSAAILDEIATYLNFNDGSGVNGEKLFLIGFGVNDICYRRYSPAAMVGYLSALVAGVNARCSNVRFAYVRPHQVDPARAGTVGITLPLAYPYADYIAALDTFCLANGVAQFQADKFLTDPTELVDGLHPSTSTHRRLAANLCDWLAVPLNPDLQVRDLDVSVNNVLPADFAMVYNSTWRPYLGGTSYAGGARRQYGQVRLFGVIEPNGSTSLTIGTLPAGARPFGRNGMARVETGVVDQSLLLAIDGATGVMTINALPTSGLIYLDGVVFEAAVASYLI